MNRDIPWPETVVLFAVTFVGIAVVGALVLSTSDYEFIFAILLTIGGIQYVLMRRIERKLEQDSPPIQQAS